MSEDTYKTINAPAEAEGTPGESRDIKNHLNIQIYGICDTIACPVTIESGVWIGGGAVILPGVTVGRNSVIGAGSVVTKSIPANSIAVGNPCRVIKSIDNEKTL